MKHTIAFLIALSLLAPVAAKAATPEEQYQQALRQVIALLIQQVQILQARLAALETVATSTLPVLSLPPVPEAVGAEVPTFQRNGTYSLDKYFPDGKQFVAYSLTECEAPELGGPLAVAKPFTFDWGVRLMEQLQMGGSTKWSPVADEEVTVEYGDQTITGRTNQDGVFLFPLHTVGFQAGERMSPSAGRMTQVRYSSRFTTKVSAITESFGCSQ